MVCNDCFWAALKIKYTCPRRSQSLWIMDSWHTWLSCFSKRPRAINKFKIVDHEPCMNNDFSLMALGSGRETWVYLMRARQRKMKWFLLDTCRVTRARLNCLLVSGLMTRLKNSLLSLLQRYQLLRGSRYYELSYLHFQSILCLLFMYLFYLPR